MYVLNKKDNFDGLANSTQIKGYESDNIDNIPKLLLSSIRGGVLSLCFIRLTIWCTLERLFSQQLKLLKTLWVLFFPKK